MSGHGISDSVRRSIKDWMSPKVIDILFKEAVSSGIVSPDGRSAFQYRLRNDTEWKRISRSKSAKAGVWQRTYYSKLFSIKSKSSKSVGLTVLTNKAKAGKAEDMFIEYVTITFAGKVIGGGKVSIPSVKLSQAGRKANIEDFSSDSIFSEFSELELAELTAKLELDEEGMFSLLEERFV